MQKVRLGRTGLEVSVAGLGSGGNSKLGLAKGKDNAVRVIDEAIDLGINLFDTAIVYGTEAVVGPALGSRRKRLILGSKSPVRVKDGLPSFDGEPASGRDMRASVEASLSRLGTDYIDIYMLHGVDKESYIHAREELLPALHRLRDQGKLRFVGLSERFLIDSRHAMLDMACADDCWDVVMLGFNMINQSAARKILPALAAKGVGTLCMYAVRHALSTDENARNLVERLIELGEVDGALLDRADPFGFVVRSGHARSLADAAYRFCRHQPGIDVVLTGTGDVGHLRDNVRSINGPALPEDILRRLGGLFSRVESLSGD